MATGALPKLALATAAVVGFYACALALPLPDSCGYGMSVAGAAPSPSCGGDLRECLRLSADMRATTFGGRYVTAEDVARCMEAFNACISGGGGRPGNPTSPSPGAGTRGGLPRQFTMRFEASGSTYTTDCQANGDAVTCTSTIQPLPPDIVNYQADFTGTLSGMTITGTEKSSQDVHYETGCTSHEEYSRPYTYVLEPGGSVTAKLGAGQRETVFTCSEPTSGSTPAGEITGTWSASGER